jgi:hypothetical protein
VADPKAADRQIACNSACTNSGDTTLFNVSFESLFEGDMSTRVIAMYTPALGAGQSDLPSTHLNDT